VSRETACFISVDRKKSALSTITTFAFLPALCFCLHSRTGMTTMGMMEPMVHWVNGEDSNAVFAAALVLLCCFYKEIHAFLQRWCAWLCRWAKVGDVTQKQLSSRNIAHETSSLASTTTPASPSPPPPPTPRRPSLLRGASSSRRSCSLLSPLSARRQSSDATRLVGTTEERPSVSWEDHSSAASSGAGQQQQKRQPTRLEILQNLERRHMERETSETSEVSPVTLSPPNSPIHKPSRSLQQRTPPPFPQRQRMDLSKSEPRMSRFISSPAAATTASSRQAASQRRGSLAEYMQVKRKLQRASFSRRSSMTNHHGTTPPKLVEEERECPETHSC